MSHAFTTPPLCQVVGMFSMKPLLAREGLLVPCAVCTTLYVVASVVRCRHDKTQWLRSISARTLGCRSVALVYHSVAMLDSLVIPDLALYQYCSVCKSTRHNLELVSVLRLWIPINHVVGAYIDGRGVHSAFHLCCDKA